MEPGEMSIEQLLDAIEKTRVQKAELEKKEAAMMKELKERAAVLNKRIEKLKSPVVTERNFDSPAMDTPKPTRR
jgi:cell division protein FtsB